MRTEAPLHPSFAPGGRRDPHRIEPGGPVETYERIIAELQAKAANAARRGKPWMWAYFTEMERSLRESFEAAHHRSDAGYAGVACATSEVCVEQCLKATNHIEAARLWAIGVYARRIFITWGIGSDHPSLDWLRQRAGIEAQP